MKINFIEKIIGSVFFTGYFPWATGTFASFIALCFYLIPGFENPTLLLILISVLIVFGIGLAEKFEKSYGKDPKEFTLDELIGTWISFLFLPKSIFLIVPAFLIWRIMDIIKPFPIRKIEKLRGGWGVVLDDVVAAFYSFIIIQITLNLFYNSLI
ncbi:phosphatidylglycerophosphatase A [Melioribacteraceae bacterium 4301-Me]|uniref:phosphatidylglycerophosphatase A family protein n=1 Tax=Pyranulibacter aquaticus TaxID=3163344 RepID=UPI003597C2A2